MSENSDRRAPERARHDRAPGRGETCSPGAVETPNLDAASRTAHADLTRSGRRRRRSRRRTLTLTVSTVLAVGAAGGGAALASAIPPAPGTADVVLRSPAGTVVHTGSATVDLGDRPDGVTGVELTLTCLSAGTLAFDHGSLVTCAPEDVAANAARGAGAAAGTPTPGVPLPHRGSAGYTVALTEGGTSTTITATDGTRWALTTAYSTRTTTGWAVNADGETYGVPEDDGSAPDLIAVATTTRTGEQGYVRNTDLNPPLDPTSPEDAARWQASPPPVRIVPLYASDGVTVLGAFRVG